MDACPIGSAKWLAVYAWATNHGYAFEKAGACKATNPPVQLIAWYDCVKWCNARSQMEGRAPCYYIDGTHTTVYRRGILDLTDACVGWSSNGYRLPREAEWERAARGGLVNGRFPWADPNTTHRNANYVSLTGYTYDTSSTRGFHPAFNDGTMLYTSPEAYFRQMRLVCTTWRAMSLSGAGTGMTITTTHTHRLPIRAGRPAGLNGSCAADRGLRRRGVAA